MKSSMSPPACFRLMLREAEESDERGKRKSRSRLRGSTRGESISIFQLKSGSCAFWSSSPNGSIAQGQSEVMSSFAPHREADAGDFCVKRRRMLDRRHRSRSALQRKSEKCFFFFRTCFLPKRGMKQTKKLTRKNHPLPPPR